MRLSATVHHCAWRAPLRSALSPEAESGSRPLILVRIETPDGMVGYGEAAPLEHYDGVSVAMVSGALEAYAPLLAAAGGIEAAGHPAVLEACRHRVNLPQALAAVDLALWDLAGRQAGKPVWRLLSEAASPPVVTVNAVIGAEEPPAAAGLAAAAVQAGYATIKVKVGTGDDLARVRAVRTAAGADVLIRVDANGAWNSSEAAVDALTALAPLGIELCEEPVHGAENIAAVSAAAPMPIAADESVGPAVLSSRVADAVCLKISASGGITGLINDARQARRLGYEVFIASTLDGPLGIAAALHTADVIAPDRACGLSTLTRFVRAAPFEVVSGQMRPPAGSGLGLNLLDWYSSGL
jgi:L-alanine-DL-glutamate epimerase-like enolase superfamily enzyme